MEVIKHILLLVVGFVFLIKGADYFVEYSSGLAKKLKISPLIIGLTIVAFGTSFPELSVSTIAAIKGNNAIAIGNVLGSNIFNLLAILGVTVLISPVFIDKMFARRDLPLSILGAILIVVLPFTGEASKLTRLDGAILLIIFAGILFIQIKSALSEKVAQDEEVSSCSYSYTRIALGIILGLAGVIFGGNVTVDAAVGIAEKFGLSEDLIGLTIVAVGTSLPELVTSIKASMKNENEIAVGNIIGSNIFNVFFILGVSSVIHPIGMIKENIIDCSILTLVSVLFFIPCIRGRLTKLEGLLMTVAYIGYTAYLIIERAAI
ncbi:MAG: calcium/sodium antiporter [Kiritimatiellae bacterium]|nr:calcium/sodium antiporter [Kiritimatiellia bacterium]